MPFAVYGKHPAKGDFVETGLNGLKPALESWLDQVLAEARHGLGDLWEPAWAAAPPLRFWLGETIWGEPVAGVLAASADKVGRRFPLVFLAQGAEVPAAPVVQPNQDWHQGLELHLQACLALDDVPTPAALVAGLGGPAETLSPTAPQPPDFWAVRPAGEAAGLWADVALTDHQRACRTRSYWWCDTGPSGWSQVWAGEGLPSGHVLAWFLRGYQEND